MSQIGGRVYLRGTIFANCSYAPYIEVSDGYQSPSVPASEFIMDPGTVYRICLFTYAQHQFERSLINP